MMLYCTQCSHTHQDLGGKMKRKFEEPGHTIKNKAFKASLPMPQLPAELNLQIFSFFNKKERLGLRKVSKAWDLFIFGEEFKYTENSKIFKKALSETAFRQFFLNYSLCHSNLSETEIFLLSEIERLGYASLYINAVYDRSLRLEITENAEVLKQFSSNQRDLFANLEKNYQSSRINRSHTPICVEQKLLELAESEQTLAIAIVKSPLVKNFTCNKSHLYWGLDRMVDLVKKWPDVATALLSNKERFQALSEKQLIKCAEKADLTKIDTSLIKRIDACLKTQSEKKEKYESLRRRVERALVLIEANEKREEQEKEIAANDEMARIQQYYNEQLSISCNRLI